MLLQLFSRTGSKLSFYPPEKTDAVIQLFMLFLLDLSPPAERHFSRLLSTNETFCKYPAMLSLLQTHQRQLLDIRRYWYLLLTYAKFLPGYKRYVKAHYQDLQGILSSCIKSLSPPVKSLLVINLQKIDM